VLQFHYFLLLILLGLLAFINVHILYSRNAQWSALFGPEIEQIGQQVIEQIHHKS
jgi:hypothetical protein